MLGTSRAAIPRTGFSPRRGAFSPWASALTLALAFVLACQAPDPFDAPPRRRLPDSGAVVSEHPLATAVGLHFLERGGNAADAAVAVALTLAVVHPTAGNLGGGGFAVWVSADGEAATLDFREAAPAGFEASLYLDSAGEVVRDRSLRTPLAVGVPGSPAGLYELHHRYGSKTLTFRDLAAPAIRLAGEGFRVDPWLARALQGQWAGGGRLTRDPAARALFFPGGEPLREGDLLRQPQLKNTLELLVRGGPEAFYQGPVAEALLRALEAADQREGGVTRGRGMTLQDLLDYEVKARPPLVGWFRGHEVIGMGPPSSGGLVLLQVLGILDGFSLDGERQRQLADSEQEPGSAGQAGLSARALHWWIEAMRCAFADRAQHLGDPDFHPVPVRELLSATWIAERRVGIGELAQLQVGPMPVPPQESAETTHLSVLDRQGNAVSLTTTLNGSFGSGILVPEAGFLLNNELDDFSIRAGTPNMYGLVGSAANQLMPHKRPLSSMTPTVVRDAAGQVTLVLGAPGGPRIITAVTQVVLRVLAYGQGLEDAVAAPRIHQQWSPPETSVEVGWGEDLLRALEEAHGQPLKRARRGQGFGSVQAIHVAPDGAVRAASDPRRGGVAGIEGQPMPRPARPH